MPVDNWCVLIRDFTHRDSGLHTPRFGTSHTKLRQVGIIIILYQYFTDFP